MKVMLGPRPALRLLKPTSKRGKPRWATRESLKKETRGGKALRMSKKPRMNGKRKIIDF